MHLRHMLHAIEVAENRKKARRCPKPRGHLAMVITLNSGWSFASFGYAQARGDTRPPSFGRSSRLGMRHWAGVELEVGQMEESWRESESGAEVRAGQAARQSKTSRASGNGCYAQQRMIFR
jgi:hypothetical protein